ncbi:hypothetical protein [Roseiconus lacunae]|uniref:Uncharacterized protein n=1 Tax=Roseiconus lacunae TaxID=2605694 RepID=A0ABT7PI58_9BACT|nr:hypothetical protein [Roseiconus lacunae]MDM4015979.1 hypothetical protein [Roseiconus lacunae]
MITDDQRQAIAVAAMSAADNSRHWLDYYERVFCDAIPATIPHDSMRDYLELGDAGEFLENLAAMRSDDPSGRIRQPSQMVTIRVPIAVHRQLIAEATAYRHSLQSIGIAKLLAPTNPAHLPDDMGAHRGRRPGPQLESGRYANEGAAITDHPRTEATANGHEADQPTDRSDDQRWPGNHPAR